MAVSVCFISLSRSDYASLRPVVRAAVRDPDIDSTLVAGGSHLLSRFGRSIGDFEVDGLSVDEIVDFLRDSDDTDTDFAQAHARACQAFVDYFEHSKPDRVFLLGDRWEMLAVASAASMLQLPVIHHSGGDITQGSRDNQTRYALSTLAHLHLVALEEHRQRLLAMGEEEWRVVTVGEPALTEVGKGGAEFDLVERPFVLATYHPTSFDSMSFPDQVDRFVEALDQVDSNILLTAPNPDPGSDTVYRKLAAYAESRDNLVLVENLGSERYYTAMDAAEYMIGNSSSGIWEAPSFGLPVINIGNRQQDRLRGENVIDVALDPAAIRDAMAKVEEVRSRSSVQQKENPYVLENTVELILETLKLDVDRDRLLAKTFVDPLKRT